MGLCLYICDWRSRHLVHSYLCFGSEFPDSISRGPEMFFHLTQRDLYLRNHSSYYKPPSWNSHYPKDLTETTPFHMNHLFSLTAQVVSCDLIPIMYIVLLVHMRILSNKQSILEGFLISLPVVKDRLKIIWPQIRLLCAKRKRERVKFVAPPKEMLHLFYCVQFLTKYDVRKRKQYIDNYFVCTKTKILSGD